MSLILVTGGARCGKSTFAERLAARLAGDRVLYVATAQAFDDDMARRIATHRAERPAAWATVESPRRVAAAIQAVASSNQLILLECLTLLASNVLLEQGESLDVSAAQRELDNELDVLIALCDMRKPPVIVVTNEVGWGVAPPTKLGCVYRDLVGRANRKLAQTASEVHLVVSGLAVDLKRLGVAVES